MTARKRLFISLGVLAVIYWVGVIGYLFIDRELSLLNAIYMVTITLSTVGYREVVCNTPANQAWTILLIMFGTTTVLVIIASLSGLLVESDLGQVFGSRKVEAKIKQLQNHTIVCGYGRMGRLLVERLVSLGVPVIVVERDRQKLPELQSADRLYVLGDATEEWILEQAGIARAKSFVAALASDADNLFVTLTARQMHSEIYIIARAEDAVTVPKLRRAGADRVISPQHIGAEWIANVLTRPNVVDFVDMASKGGELEMAEIAVPAESPLAGKSLRQADVRKLSDVIVVAIRRADGTRRFNPSADEIINSGDVLITVGEAGAALKLSTLRSGHFGAE